MDIAITNRSGRNTKNWKNIRMEWPALKKRLSETLYTLETVGEYHAATKEAKSDYKDHGGFVGGYLTEGRRLARSVKHRSLVCLDLDSATPETWSVIQSKYDFECLVYSTHSHKPDSPRLRLIIPLYTPVNADEYQAIGRRIADEIGMKWFDATTFQPERLMYWPSTPKDGEFFYAVQEGPILDPEEILSTYTDPADISSWPQHPNEQKIIAKKAAVLGDPTDKEGVIGAFCRAFNVYDALDEFLSDVYEPTAVDDRYTFIAGTSAAGAIVYDNNFMFSHHSTDPIHGMLCNSFDLVRIHLYGAMDEDSKATSPKGLPSFKKMIALAISRPEVTEQSVKADFSEYADDPKINLEWVKNLRMDKQGLIETIIPNFELIIDNDPRLKGRFFYDEFEDRTFGRLPLPWEAGDRPRDLKDIDDSLLESYISKEYKIHHSANIKKAFDNVCYKYKVHPVRDYLDKLVWDKVPRVESLLTEFMGADDNEYTRVVIRKALVACVTRIYSPGTKFDNAVILVGDEGIYKSTLIAKLGGKWFSDSFMGVAGLDAMQQLQGTWLMEMPELAGLKKADVTAIKSFLSKTMDKYRSSYGRRNNIHPRQTVFFGTTNERTPLKGDTGNRRFWPVVVRGVPREKFEKLNVDQIWAEAKFYFMQKEDLDLPEHVRAEAKEIQKKHTESDSRAGIIANYLDMPVPENWEEMTRQERIYYINKDKNDIQPEGVKLRDKVCAAEIWVELLGGSIKDLNTWSTKSIHDNMATLSGWEVSENPLSFPIYGRQKAFIRVGGSIKVKTVEKIKEEEMI